MNKRPPMFTEAEAALIQTIDILRGPMKKKDWRNRKQRRRDAKVKRKAK